MRTKIVAGNWKMNKTYKETKALVKELNHAVKELTLDNTRVIISPTFVNLQKASKMTKKSVIEVAAQNMHQEASGAYTGEISAGDKLFVRPYKGDFGTLRKKGIFW